MKFFMKNIVIKKFLVILITIIMISNFIMPNSVYAESSGEKLVSSFFYLIAKFGDAILGTMQGFMVGDGEIRDADDNFQIKYSPGMIFSNKVLLLDVNFISPNKEVKEVGGTVNNEYSQSIFSNTYVVTNAGSTQISDPKVIYEGESVTSRTGAVTITKGQGASKAKVEELLNTYGGKDATASSVVGKTVYKWTNSATSIEYELTFSYYSDSKGFTENIVLKQIGGITTSHETVNPSDKVKELLTDYGYYTAKEENKEEKTTGSAQNNTHTYEWKNDKNEKFILTVSFKQNGSVSATWTVNLNKIGKSSVTNTKTISSAANQLQKYISSWYVALRTIALVGLLSVLVYLGIKIIISSSSAQDRAKYKNMLKDWLVAICIIFMVHYIMAFLLGITQYVNEIINDEVITTSADGTESDELMNKVRGEIGNNLIDTMKDPNDHVVGYTIMYIALVILTGIFTVQYLKRVIYMAFLTMVAPLIGLTYPIDKLKDGKAQAFNYWLKEYIFNCLIQPIHLLLYTVLIANSISFAKENILYAIVALAFLVPAEKLIKEMFGMKSNSPSGTLGAAAGGAVVMSMLQKLRAKPPKEEAEGAGGKAPTGVRTATRTPGVTLGGAPGGTIQTFNMTPANAAPANAAQANAAPANAAQANAAPANAAPANAAPTNAAPANAAPANAAQANAAQANAAQANAAQANAAQANATQANAAQANATQADSTSTSSTFGAYTPTYTIGPSIGRGLSELRKKYIGGVDDWKTRGKKFTRATGRAIGGAALGTAAATVAFASEVADGHLFEDPSTAFRNTATGAVAGYMTGSNITGHVMQTGKNIFETYKQGAEGAEQYNNMKFDKEFFKSDGYKNIEQDATILSSFGGDTDAIKTATQEFLNNGITDSAKIREYMQHGITGNDAKDFSVVGIDKVTDIEKLQSEKVNPTDYGMYSSAGFAKAQDIVDLKKEGIGASDIKHFASAGVKDANKILKAKRAHPGLSNEGLATRFALAKHAPKDLANFKAMMVGRIFEGHTVTDADAEAIFKELVDFF